MLCNLKNLPWLEKNIKNLGRTTKMKRRFRLWYEEIYIIHQRTYASQYRGSTSESSNIVKEITTLPPLNTYDHLPHYTLASQHHLLIQIVVIRAGLDKYIRSILIKPALNSYKDSNEHEGGQDQEVLSLNYVFSGPNLFLTLQKS